MELIIGYKGEAHVTSRQYRDIMQSIAGTGSYIADLGEQLVPELASNNLIKIRSGMLFHHGSISEVPDGTYDEVTITNGTQNMKRIDLIVSRYTKNSDTGVEKSEWVVIQGTPAASDPTVPAHTEGNMQDGDLVDDCPVYEVELDGINVTEVRTLLSVMPHMTDEATTSKAGLMSADDKTDLEAIKAATADLVDIQCGKEVLDWTTTVQSKTINFPRKMRGTNTPVIVITIGGGSYWADKLRATAATTNQNGFTVNYVGTAASSVDINWIAVGR